MIQGYLFAGLVGAFGGYVFWRIVERRLLFSGFGGKNKWIMPFLAEKVAEIHMENIGKGRKVSIDSIAESVGLSRAYATSGHLQESKAFRDTIEKFKPKTTRALMRTVGKSTQAINKKDLNKESARDLMAIVDTGIKNVQLLSGGATNNIALNISISEAIANKNQEDTKVD